MHDLCLKMTNSSMKRVGTECSFVWVKNPYLIYCLASNPSFLCPPLIAANIPFPLKIQYKNPKNIASVEGGCLVRRVRLPQDQVFRPRVFITPPLTGAPSLTHHQVYLFQPLAKSIFAFSVWQNWYNGHLASSYPIIRPTCHQNWPK